MKDSVHFHFEDICPLMAKIQKIIESHKAVRQRNARNSLYNRLVAILVSWESYYLTLVEDQKGQIQQRQQSIKADQR